MLSASSVFVATCVGLMLSGCTSRGASAGAGKSPQDLVNSNDDRKRIVLFDGTSTSAWEQLDGSEVAWHIENGVMRVSPGQGSIQTRELFDDFTLHVEFNIPDVPEGASGQSRGNTGVYLQRRYEIQILDSAGMKPASNLCGGIYRQRAPDTNAARPAGEWQSFDIDFTSPTWDERGRKISNARLTVWHNDVLIHDDVEVTAKTGAGNAEGPEPGAILLQDHGAEVAFRNIWITR